LRGAGDGKGDQRSHQQYSGRLHYPHFFLRNSQGGTGSVQAKAPVLHSSLPVEKRTILSKRTDGNNSYIPGLDLPEPMLHLQEHNGLVP
jgi:hypothetical protein